jgi:L-lactate utilization protein LutC
VRSTGPRTADESLSARETILRRLAAASTEAPLPAVSTPGLKAPSPELVAPGPTLEATQRFVERATDVGAEVRLVAAAQLSSVVVDIVAAAGAREIVIWGDPLLAETAAALRRAGVTVLIDDDRPSEAAASAAFGLTTADYAIAETGTLVLATGPGRSRGASLLPGHHIAVLPEDRISADLFTLMGALRHPLPSAMTFVTGPSRSADIGLTPVQPAHGPMAVTILVVSAVELHFRPPAPDRQ